MRDVSEQSEQRAEEKWFFFLLFIFVIHRVYGGSNNKPSSTSKGMEKREDVRKKKNFFKCFCLVVVVIFNWSSESFFFLESLSLDGHRCVGVCGFWTHIVERDMEGAREEIEIRWLRLHRARAAKETGRVCTWRRLSSPLSVCAVRGSKWLVIGRGRYRPGGEDRWVCGAGRENCGRCEPELDDDDDDDEKKSENRQEKRWWKI